MKSIKINLNQIDWNEINLNEIQLNQTKWNKIGILSIDESEAETVFLTVLKSHFKVSLERKEGKKDIFFVSV